MSHAAPASVATAPDALAGAGAPIPESDSAGDSPPVAPSSAADAAASPEEPAIPAIPDGAGASASNSSRERLFFLLDDEPLLVDLELSIDGKPYAESLSAVVDQALRWCDTDGDGKPTWQEAAQSPRFSSGQLGNAPPRDAGERQRLIKLYDVNRNGLVEREELPRFLTRNAGKARPFTWSTSNEYHDTNRAQSAVRRWLDEDDDGWLSPEEIDHAPKRLRLRDADGDDVLAAAEFRDTMTNESDRLSNRRQTQTPDRVFLLGPHAAWDALHYAFREVYAGGGELHRDGVSLPPESFARLDANSDGRLDRQDLAKYDEFPADLVLAVRCGERPDEVPSRPLEVVTMSDRLAPLTPKARFTNRLSVHGHGTRIEFFVNDQLGQQDVKAQAAALVARYDRDDNGYLDAEEYPEQELGMRVPLATVDENGDEKVFAEELATFLQQRDAASRSQIRGRAADHPDALFTALDGDGDGQLKSREIERAADRLRELDGDRDGQLRSSEIPGSLVVGFVRGNPQQEAALFVAPPATPLETAVAAPQWFTAMDGNGDGDISPREFLGAPELFQRLDADHDGFVSWEEARAP